MRLVATFSQVAFTLRATEIIACTGLAIGILEEFSRLGHYTAGGLYSWRILSTRRPFVGDRLLAKTAAMLFGPRGMICLMLLAVSSLLVIAFDCWPTWRALPLGTIVIYLLLAQIRNVYGFDGSDQMYRIVFCCLFGASLFNEPSRKGFFLCVMAIHAIMAYVCSAIHKLKGKLWRNGEALARIMSTQTFGDARTANWLLRHRQISGLANWATIAFQLLFPIVLVVPPDALVIILIVGAGFHAAIAQLMGLNTFLTAFVATYPCIIYLNYVLLHTVAR